MTEILDYGLGNLSHRYNPAVKEFVTWEKR